MGTRVGFVVTGIAVVAGLMGTVVAAPARGEAAEEGKPKITLSLTKDYTPSPWTNEVGYSNRAIGKLAFGAKNLLLGWTELFTEPKEALDSGGNFFVGLGTGLKNAVEQELGGAVHLVTFPITAIDAPLPEGGTKIL